MAETAITPSIFTFQQSKVRTIIENGQPWFVGRDIALLLGYARADNAIRDHCKHTKLFKCTDSVHLKIPTRGLLIIPEADVWRLIVKSTLPKAQEVEEWIMSEVLPTIRKTGKFEAAPRPVLPAPILRDTWISAYAEDRRVRFAGQYAREAFRMANHDMAMETLRRSGSKSAEHCAVYAVQSLLGIRETLENAIYYAMENAKAALRGVA